MRESKPDSLPTAHDQCVTRISQPLYQSSFWIRLVAITLIINGAVLTITGIGVLVAWIPMLLGVLLLSTVRSINLAYRHNNEQALMFCLNRFKTIFTITGIASVVLLASTAYIAWHMINQSSLL